MVSGQLRHLGLGDGEQVLEDLLGLRKALLRGRRIVIVEDDRVQHVQLGLVVLGEKQDVVEDLSCGVGEVGGVEDLADLEHGAPPA